MEKYLLIFVLSVLTVYAYKEPELQCHAPNEISGWVTNCPPEATCKTRDEKYNCPEEDTNVDDWKKKCICREGFYRNAIGECISAEDCDKCPGEYEFYSCGGFCDNECSTIGTENRTHCNTVNIKCNEKCYCEDGYARDESRKCVPVDQCTAKQCNPHTEDLRCVKKCPPERTCKTRNIFISCLHNENEQCQTKCVCKKGYYRNDSGQCVTDAQCAQSECHAPNEELRCVKKCPPETTCKTRDTKYHCPKQDVNSQCEQKCVCKEGYYRNAIGSCISAEDCDKCRGEHEFYSCGSACDNECSSMDTRNSTHCDIINIKCNEMCYCEDGYARDEFGKCVPLAQCTEGCSGPHEWRMKCRKSCAPDTCMSLVARFACVPDPPCEDACVCQSGYLRLKKGQPCMPMRQCPEMANSPDSN